MNNKPLPTFEAFINEDFIKPETGKNKYVIKMPSGKYHAGDKKVEKKDAWSYFNQADAQSAADSIDGSVETVNQTA